MIFLEIIKFVVSLKRFTHIKQLGSKDCGPTCLKIVANWYGKNYDINFLRHKCNISKVGVSMLDIIKAAESIGFRTLSVKIDINKLDKILKYGPCIIHWQQKHFVVLYKLKKSFFRRKHKYYISDPARGRLILNKGIFCRVWKGNKEKGYALLLEPNKDFHTEQCDRDK